MVNEALNASRRTFIGLAIFSFFTSILMLTGPLYMLQVYDRVLMSQSVPTLVALTVLVAALYLTLGVLEWCRNALFSAAGSQLEGRLAAPVMEAAFEAQLKDPRVSGEQSVRDLRTVRRFIGSPTLPAVFDMPFTPLFFLVLFMLHWAYGLWALAGGAVLVTLAIVNRIVNQKPLEEAEKEERIAQHQAGEMLRQSQIVAALGMADRLRSRWKNSFDNSDAGMLRSGSRLAGFTSGTKAFRLLMQSGILGLGAYLSILEVSTPGAMIAASIIMGRAIAPVEQTVGQWRNIVQSHSAWNSLSALLGTGDKDDEPMELPPIQGRVTFENVSAGPPGSRTAVLKRINFDLQPGEVLGLIGPSAGGKSTLARVLIGLWPTLMGNVRIDGADVASYPTTVLGAQLGYLPQRVDLFTGTIRDNISRFNMMAPPEAVIAAAQAADCHDLILHLPDGYDTDIGPSGAFLSDGQRQRVGLARALFGDPKLVVLDEPNSNLDSEGDAALQNAIKRLKARGATVIIIAHRPNAITHCDQLLLLHEGEVRMMGPRDEVLAKLVPAGNDNDEHRVAAIRRGEVQNG
ncbi:MAG: type I secretion system permease/ATPase [Pseudomonadota bacterium]